MSLDHHFRSQKARLLSHDKGDGSEVLLDWVRVAYFEK
jgi:hypothetical protein